jgi:hypothetical protein
VPWWIVAFIIAKMVNLDKVTNAWVEMDKIPYNECSQNYKKCMNI